MNGAFVIQTNIIFRKYDIYGYALGRKIFQTHTVRIFCVNNMRNIFNIPKLEYIFLYTIKYTFYFQ